MPMVHCDHIDEALHDVESTPSPSRQVEDFGVCAECLNSILNGLFRSGMSHGDVASFGAGIVTGVRACQVAIAESN